MGLLDRLRWKKEKQKESIIEEKIVTNLEKMCADDKECYEALCGAIFLDPKKVGTSSADAVKMAKEFEKQGNTMRATVWYEIAGRLALYEGDAAKVEEYFGKCTKLSPNNDYPILRNPEKALKKAQEYYQKYLT